MIAPTKRQPLLNGHDPERAHRALLAIDPGNQREKWIRAAMAAKAAGLGFEDFHDWSSAAGNYAGESDCRTVWKSIRDDGGIGAGTLFAMAQEAGWREDHPLQAPPPPGKPKSAAFDLDFVWRQADPDATHHPYIVRKGGTPEGLRVYRGQLRLAGEELDGALIVPVADSAGRLVSAQFILESGRKLNAPGRPLSGIFTVGSLESAARIFVVEGIGQAWTAAQSTGHPSVVTFGAGRLDPVARELRRKRSARPRWLT